MEYTINGKSYPISEFIKSTDGKQTPLIDVKMMSDYDWQKRALESRLLHREKYSRIEDVDEAINGLRAWLKDHDNGIKFDLDGV